MFGLILYLFIVLLLFFIIVKHRSPLIFLLPSLVYGIPAFFYLHYNSTLGWVILLVLLCSLVTSFLLMSSLGFNGTNISLVLKDYRVGLRNLRVKQFFFSSVFLLVLFFLIVDKLQINNLISYKRMSDADSLTMALLQTLSAYGVVPIVYFSGSEKSNLISKVFIAIILFVLFLTGYLISSRSLFLTPIIFGLMIWFITNKNKFEIFKFSRVLTMSSILILVLLAFVYIAGLRASNENDSVFEKGLERLEYALVSGEGYGISPAKDLKVYEYSLNGGFSFLDPIHLFGGFYALIPRDLWPTKPEIVFSGKASGAYVFRESNYLSDGAGIPISFASELSIIFGANTLFIGYILSAVIISLVFVRSRNPVLMLGAIYSSPALLVGGFASFTFIYIKVFILSWIILKTLRI